MKKRVLATLLALVCMGSITMTACGEDNSVSKGKDKQNVVTKKDDEDLIEERIEEFVEAYNDGDFDGVLDCMEPKTRNALRSLFNVLGGVLGSATGVGGVAMSDLFSLGIWTMSDGEVMEVDIEEITVSGDEAVATANLVFDSEDEGTVYFTLVKEKGKWYIEDMTDKKQVGESVSGITFNRFSSAFVDGKARVVYEKDGTEYFGVMDEDGNIYGSLESSLNLWNDMGAGACYLDFADVCLIMNTDGEITEVITDYDEVIDAGYGMAWLYKREDSIDGSKHFYGLIDSEGEWIMPFTDLGTYPPSGVSSSVSMLSEDILLMDDYYGYTHHYTIYNLKTKKTIWLKDATVYGEYNGTIYVKYGDWLGGISFDGEEWQDIYECFCIYEDGSCEEIEEFDSITDGKMIIRGDEYIEIVDLATNKTVRYTNYTEDMVDDIIFNGEYGLVTLYGKDGNRYFTLINEKGKQQFEPIKYINNVNYSDGAIVYCTYYDGWTTANNLYAVVDEEGEELISDDMGFCAIGAFSNGISIAMDGETEEYFYIDKNGDRAFEEFNIIEFDLEEIVKQFK